jgi:1-acyl-sn-glycerol-3-phosphate acyltransferase
LAEAANPRHPSVDRAALCARLAAGLADWGASEKSGLERSIASELSQFTDAELAHFSERLAETGGSWGFHPHDPVARRISRLAQKLVLLEGSGLEASESLEVARKGPVFFVANHLSYIDANVLDSLMVMAGYADVADSLTVLAGPKVYSLPTRRLASLCFGSIKIPQSQSIASGEAVMPRREVARLAGQTLEAVEARHRSGEHVMIFIEGTRSRTGGMQRVLAASARYFEAEGSIIVPIGLWGTEKLVPLDSMDVTAEQAHGRVGKSVTAAELFGRADGKRPVIADALGFLIADLLPAEYRGVYGEVGPALQSARAAAASLSS